MNKEAQRAELHRTIWRIANDLRGSVDGWDFKTYVLGMLFYRFISENLTDYLNRAECEAGNPDFDYADLRDSDAREAMRETVIEKGFYVFPSELFANVRERAHRDPNLNETLARVFTNIERSAVGTDSEGDLKGLFDDLDVNSSKLGNTVARRNERLVKLLDAIGDLNLGTFSDNTIDAFGDAYEYLMTMYASSAGKSGGEFFTPQEVSELLARITVVGKTEVNKVYDPACGSGSLLLKFAKVLGKDNVRQGFYGQEINLTTYNLCRINMFLHDINFEKFSIAHGDTLIDPAHWDDEPFEAIVSNPPYSIQWDGDANPLLINDTRYAPAGVLAPKSKADLAFTMHMLSWLAVNGTAAIVEFPGVLYRGGAEQEIRKYLIENNYVDAVIQLPPDLFFGTKIATCVIVLKKSKSDDQVLFIDASAEFVRGGNKNKLTEANRARILEAFTARREVQHFAGLVDRAALSENGYTLSVSTWVELEDTREVTDITELNARIVGIVARQTELRVAIDEIVSQLDTFHEEALRRAGDGTAARWVHLGDIGSFYGGLSGKSREDFADGNAPFVTYMNVYSNPAALLPSKEFVRVTPGERQNRVARGDILFTTSSESREEVGMSSVVTAEPYEVTYLNSFCFGFRPHSLEELTPGFAKHLFRAPIVREQIVRTANGVTRFNLSRKAFARVRIPLPPVGQQERITAILDKFDALLGDVSSGLPAEIAARAEQHRYYRDLLLSPS